MYETVSQCDAILASNKSAAAAAAIKSATTNLDDSYSQLGIKKSSGAISSSRSDYKYNVYLVASESCLRA